MLAKEGYYGTVGITMQGVVIWFDNSDPGVGYAANILSHILGPVRMAPLSGPPPLPCTPALLLIGLRGDGFARGGFLESLGRVCRAEGCSRVIVFLLECDAACRLSALDALRDCASHLPRDVVVFPGADGMPRRAEVIEYGLSLRDELLASGKAAPPGQVRARAEEFLGAHNTCTLCTGSAGRVRATPVEYHYHDGTLVILSEGGEKFAHILRNPQVSVAVYEPYTGMDRLAGVQVQGEAVLVTPGTSLYKREVRARGLDPDQVMALPCLLHMIIVTMTRLEFIHYSWQREGYDLRQVYWFPHGERAA